VNSRKERKAKLLPHALAPGKRESGKSRKRHGQGGEAGSGKSRKRREWRENRDPLCVQAATSGSILPIIAIPNTGTCDIFFPFDQRNSGDETKNLQRAVEAEERSSEEMRMTQARQM
jgi:hypothetical protein